MIKDVDNSEKDSSQGVQTDNTYELKGNHPKIREANARALCVAGFPARVLLQGASGTGKSMLARHIHYNSGRTVYKSVCYAVWKAINGVKLKEMLAWAAGLHKTDEGKEKPDFDLFTRELENNPDGIDLPGIQNFREINLAALPEQTISSELFGYVNGAFTDANENGSPGLFINANGGTLFLDEIADCPLSIQAKLLSVIQQRKKEDGDCACYVIPNGQEEEVRVNVRLICATNKDLFKEVKAGNFREDLYYRLKEYEIRLPSLSELIPYSGQSDDKQYLRAYVQEEMGKINSRLKEALSRGGEYRNKVLGQEAENILLNYPFPGNYRELQRSLMQACLNARTRFILGSSSDGGHLDGEDGEEIQKTDLPDEIQKYNNDQLGDIVDECIK